MDILSALPEEIFNEIVSYLSGNDVLNSTLVCKAWCQIFGQSYESMKKITAKYTNYNHKNDLNTLLLSERKYENIKIGFRLNQYMDFHIEQNIKAILAKFSDTIVTIESTNDIMDVCDLPKLRELHIDSSHLNRYYFRGDSEYLYETGLIAKCTNIRKLIIESPYRLDVKSLLILQEALNKMQNLKSLTVNESKLFQCTEWGFALEEFNLTVYRTDMNFLKAHQSTLKIIRLDNASFENLEIILAEFPNLHKLHVRLLDISIHDIELPQNETIKTLIISRYIADPKRKFASMLLKLKKLEHLKLRELNWNTMVATPDCSALKTVEFQTWDREVNQERKNWMKKNNNIRLIKRRVKYVYN